MTFLELLGNDINISTEKGSKMFEYPLPLRQCASALSAISTSVDFNFIQGCWNNSEKNGQTGAHGFQPKASPRIECLGDNSSRNVHHHRLKLSKQN